MKITPIRNNFNGGEVSPKIDWRGDADKYQSGCKTLQNFIPLVEGGVVRMPGTYFVTEVKDSTKATIVKPFKFSTIQTYILEVGEQYIRFYKDSAQVQDAGVPVEVVTSYLEADLPNVNITQSADVLYTFHTGYPPAKLSRLSDISWTFGDIKFSPPPTREIGYYPDATVTPSAVTGTGIDFTSSVAVFLAGDVGRVIKYGASRASITSITSTTVVVCDILDDFPSLDAIASGDWLMQYSPNSTLTPSATKTGQICTLTSDIDAFRASDVGKYAYVNGGFLRITVYTSTLAINGEVLQDLSSVSATSAWSLEDVTWDSVNGYPNYGVFFEQRLATGGAPGFPQTLNFSVSGDYENFSRNPSLTDASMEFTLVSNQVEGIHWLAGVDFLMIGTLGGVWKFGATNSNDPLSQSNISAKKQTGIGTKDSAPLHVTDSILWTSLSGMTISRLDYSFENDKYNSTNMTRVAGHITRGSTALLSGAVDMAFQTSPIPIVWVVRADGQLLGMTYDIHEKVYAWFRVVTDGFFESVAAISKGDQEDEVWVVVRRVIDGATKRYVEYFKPIDFYDIRDCFYVHSGVTYDGGAELSITGITNALPAVVSVVNTYAGGEIIRVTDVEGMTEVNLGLTKAYTVANPTATTIELLDIDSTGWGVYTSGGVLKEVKKDFTSGLSHLEGEVVDVLVDGATHPQVTVIGGAISLERYGNRVHVGLPAPAIVEPTTPFVDIGGGINKGKKERVNRVTLSFFETYGGNVGTDPGNVKPIKFGTGTDPVLFSGEKTLPFDGSWGRDAPLIISQTVPLPMTLRSISYELSVNAG